MNYVIGWISKQFRDFVSFFIDLDQHLGVQHPNAEQTTQHLKTQNSNIQNHKHVPFKSIVFSRPKCCPMTNYMCKIYLNALFLFQIFVNLNFKKLLKNRNHEIGAGQLIIHVFQIQMPFYIFAWRQCILSIFSFYSY